MGKLFALKVSPNFPGTDSRALKTRSKELKAYFGMKIVGSLLTTATLLLVCADFGCAHKVNVFAYVEGDTIVVEGYFGGNVKAQNSAVEVLDSDGKKTLEGKTDEKGIYRFKLADLQPIKGDIKIVLEGGMGHKADFTLSAADLPGAVQQRPNGQPQLGEKATGEPSSSEPYPSVRSQDSQAMKKVVEDAVDRKIQPVLKMLGAQQKLLMEQRDRGPTVTEIIGGIGWILGLVGVAGYFMGRNRKKTS
jgi:nickel transport protein